MALHNGLETTAIITFGVYSKVYGVSNPANLANLFASLGYLEDAPALAVGVILKIDPTKRIIKFYSSKVNYHNS